jgi:hypothetical protein
MRLRYLLAALSIATSAVAQQTSTPPVALTIYNQDFAVARTQVDLDLHPGLNEIKTAQVTSQLEPDSVVLRDPSGKQPFHILEQNYDAGVVNQQWLLEKYEGKTLSFQVGQSGFVDGHFVSGPTVQGKIIRAGGQQNGYPQSQPLIEVDGHVLFQLPGTPLFPPSTDGLLLKPTLRWQIQADKAQKLSAELAYITGGISWEATYNVVAPQSDNVTGQEKADILGWVTIHNQSGSEFPQARIKLMAGDVAKIIAHNGRAGSFGAAFATTMDVAVSAGPQVTQKPFDDFHLYDLNRTVALRDGEIKQVQFINASGVSLKRSYVYDGTAENLQPYRGGQVNQQRDFGFNPGSSKVHIVEEFKNSQANHLGIPLPAGRVRLYRQDGDGQMEFVGESTINHTPTEDTVKITTGSAFDVKGTRRQTEFHVNQSERTVDETFEIKLTNQKQQSVTVAAIEHLYRGDNWEIATKSSEYTKLDSHTIQFLLEIPAKGESTLTYTVHYTW